MKSVQEVSKHVAGMARRLARKPLMLRPAPGRARTCNPMIRSYILRLAKAIKRTISAPEWLPK